MLKKGGWLVVQKSSLWCNKQQFESNAEVTILGNLASGRFCVISEFCSELWHHVHSPGEVLVPSKYNRKWE